MHLYAFVQAAEIWVKTESRSRGYLHMSQPTLWQPPRGSVKKGVRRGSGIHFTISSSQCGPENSSPPIWSKKERKTGGKVKILEFSSTLCALWRAANSLFLSKVETRQKCHTFIGSTISNSDKKDGKVDCLSSASSSTVISEAGSGPTVTSGRCSLSSAMCLDLHWCRGDPCCCSYQLAVLDFNSYTLVTSRGETSRLPWLRSPVRRSSSSGGARDVSLRARRNL